MEKFMKPTHSRVFSSLLLFALFISTSHPVQSQQLTVKEVGGDTIDHVIYVEAPGHFRLGAVRGMNYGLSEWYDLVNDPAGKLNIAHRPDDNEADQASLFNQVINPDDLIGHILIAKYLFKDTPRSGRIIEQNPVRVILETEYHPMLSHVSNVKLTLKTTYAIYYTGRIGIVNSMQANVDQGIEMWRNSTISLGDPTYHFNSAGKGNCKISGDRALDESQNWKPDEWAGWQVNFPGWITYEILGNTATELKLGKQLAGGKPATDGPYDINSQTGKYGWLRCSDRQSPYSWQNSVSDYLRMYWDPNTPEPYRNWTKANILLVPKPGNPNQGGQNIHGWERFKRFYYEYGKFDLAAGKSVTQYYLIQLGTAGDTLLPDFSNPATAIAQAENYRNPSPLEFTAGAAGNPVFDFATAAYKITSATGKVSFKAQGDCIKPVFEIAGKGGKSLPTVRVNGSAVDVIAAQLNNNIVLVQLLTDLKSGSQCEISIP